MEFIIGLIIGLIIGGVLGMFLMCCMVVIKK